MAKIDASGTQFCQRLDLKPIGPIAAPALLPICPEDGFVVYKETFSEDEITTLRPWVESDEFRRMTREESPYYRVAQTLERLSAPDDTVASIYISASWEVESDPDRYRRYLALAISRIDSYRSHIKAGKAAQDGWPAEAAALLAAELERRLGQFEAARRRLTPLAEDSDLEGNLLEVIRYELELIEQSDAGPHYWPRDDQERCGRWDIIPRRP
jgi:hypothetical protein